MSILAGVDTYDLLTGAAPKPLVRVIVRFEGTVPAPLQGVALLAFEKHLRKLTGLDCRVYKDLKGDDSKLRVLMTQAQRDKL